MVNLLVFALFPGGKPIFLLKITDFPTSMQHTFHKFVSQNRNQASAPQPMQRYDLDGKGIIYK